LHHDRRIDLDLIFKAVDMELDLNRKMAANHQLQVEETIADMAALDAIYGHETLEDLLGNLS